MDGPALQTWFGCWQSRMHLNCPHCGTTLLVSPDEHAIVESAGVSRQLLGGEYVCNECENDLDIYYF